MKNNIGILLAGGKGTRLWPLSTPSHPKQFLIPTNHTHSLFTQTIHRIAPLCDALIICSPAEYLTTIQQHLPHLHIPIHIIIEPQAKNTTFAITLAMLYASHYYSKQATLLCTPTDHYIEHTSIFRHHLWELIQHNHTIGLLGITPTYINNQYGHIICNKTHPSNLCQITGFIEKPSTATITQLAQHHTLLWNSGLFTFPIIRLSQCLQQYQPTLLHITTQLFATHQTHNNITTFHTNNTRLNNIPSIPIDKAIIEHCPYHCHVKQTQCGWTDIGSWEGLWNISKKNNHHQCVYPLPEPISNATTGYTPTTHNDITITIDTASQQLVMQRKENIYA